MDAEDGDQDIILLVWAFLQRHHWSGMNGSPDTTMYNKMDAEDGGDRP